MQPSLRAPASGAPACLHSFAGQRLHQPASSRRQQQQRVAARAQVQEAQTIGPVYAAAWVSKAREDKILRRVYQDVRNLKFALNAEVEPENGAASNGAGPGGGDTDSEFAGELKDSFLGVLGQLELDQTGQEGEPDDYQVGELAYGEAPPQASNIDSTADPMDAEDKGDTSTGLQSLLANPVLPLNIKMQALTNLKEHLGLKRLTLDFLQLLIKEGRIGALDAILDSFEILYNDAINLQVANVRSAAPLDQEDKYAIAKIVQGRSGRRHVRVKVEQDPSLLAGFIVEFNYETLDFSVKAAIKDAVERTAGALGVEVAA